MTAEPTPLLPDLSRRVAATANRVLARARDAGRDDLADQVRAEAARWGQRDTSVVILGGGRSGKTSLVNALCGRAVLPDVQGGVPHVLVRAADEPGLDLHTDSGGEPTPLDPGTLDAWITSTDGVLDLQCVDIELPDGLVLLDTPAVDALETRRRDRAVEALEFADAAVLCIPASGPITSSDLALLRRIGTRVEHVFIAYTRIDRIRDWDRLVADTGAILEREGIEARLFPVSSRLAAMTWPPADLDDQERLELLDESGIPALRETLVEGVAHQVEAVRLANLVRSCRTVLGQLEAVERATKAALDDHAGAISMAELEATQLELEALTRDSSSWMVDLSDQLGLLRESIGTEVNRRATATLDLTLERMESGEFNAADLTDELRSALAFEEDDLLQRAVDGAAEIARAAEAAVEGEPVMLEPLATILSPNREPSTDDPQPKKRSSRDLGSITRVGAMIATSSSGVAMMAMSVQGAGASPSMQLARGLAFGFAALLGTASGTATLRQSRQQKRSQDARAEGRRLVDEWRSALATQVRKTLLVTQREAERGLKARILERKRSIEETIKAKQTAARADLAERKAQSAESAARLERLESLVVELDTLAGDIAAFGRS